MPRGNPTPAAERKRRSRERLRMTIPAAEPAPTGFLPGLAGRPRSAAPLSELEEVKLRKDRAAAELAETRAARERGELIPRGGRVHATATAVLGVVRRAVESLPRMVPPDARPAAEKVAADVLQSIHDGNPRRGCKRLTRSWPRGSGWLPRRGARGA